jgi:bifunctional N-acetylglucosamine-1-phosphate-uridyltransferase/glucosamine-1-phosphate-acetyltransferase GlmU-like protein
MEKQVTSNPQETPAPLDVLILAAGLGTRMRSQTAKVLHRLAGRPLIAHVCRTAAALSPPWARSSTSIVRIAGAARPRRS